VHFQIYQVYMYAIMLITMKLIKATSEKENNTMFQIKYLYFNNTFFI